MIITNENDGYIFFEIIKRLEARSILDVGMLLKRIGAVSRCAMNEEVPKDALLVGVDFFPETDFLVWKNIYDEIISKEEFLTYGNAFSGKTEKICKEEPSYELAVLLGTEELIEKASLSDMIRSISQKTRYVLTDMVSEEWKRQKPDLRIIDVSVENDRYYLLDLGE